MDLVARHVAASTAAERSARTRGRGDTGIGSTWVEAQVALVINLMYLAGIVLVPVGISALFIRLSRRFMSS
jgi:hypothetical protein